MVSPFGITSNKSLPITVPGIFGIPGLKNVAPNIAALITGNKFPTPILGVIEPNVEPWIIPANLAKKAEKIKAKEDIAWPYDWNDPFVFKRRLEQLGNNHNQDYAHQALVYNIFFLYTIILNFNFQ